MKAYLVAHRQPLPPFRKPVAELRFKEGSLRQRLETQLRAAGLEVVAVDAVPDDVAPRSVVVSDDVVLSRNLLRRFLAAIPDRGRSYQAEIESGPLFVTFSAGVATQGGYERFADVQDLLRAADDVLYRSKNLGRNRVIARSPGALGHDELSATAGAELG